VEGVSYPKLVKVCGVQNTSAVLPGQVLEKASNLTSAIVLKGLPWNRPLA